MLPIQLTIEGLYSYQERQTIDFTSLTEVGLFGIFGNVGSGKSSILEAITFALYGNSDRLGKSDFAYNMMNLKSNKLFIEFEFLNHENKHYKITREYKRNSKNFEKITNSGVVLYELIDNNWMPQESSDVEPILGLSSENFRRTIIIPQGKFQDFIQLKPTERTHMMKDIFNLHRYDLQDKVAALNSKNTTNLNLLQGKLSGFEEVSEEIIKTHQDKLSSENEIAVKLQQEVNQINENFQRLKRLKDDFERLKQKKVEFEKLNHQKEIVQQKKVQLDLYERIYHQFHQKLFDLKKVKKELEINSTEKEQQQKELVALTNQLENISTKISTIKPYFDELTTKQKEENDLELIIQIFDYQKNINDNKVRTQNGLERVEEVKAEVKAIDDQIKLVENEIKYLAKNRINSSNLIDAGNWFSQQKNIQETATQQQQKIENLEQKIIQLLSTFKVEGEHISEEDYLVNLNDLEKNKTVLEQQKTHIQVQEQLAHYAHNLHDGEACPLCGALEHPSKIELENISDKALLIENELKVLNDKINLLKNIFSEKKFIDDQLKVEKESAIHYKNLLEEHFKKFIWKEFDAHNFDDFETKRNNTISLEKSLEEKNSSIQKSRENLETARQKVERFSKELERIRVEEIQKETQIQQNKNNLKVLDFNDFTTKNVEEIQQELIVLKQKNSSTEKEYNALNEELNKINPLLSVQKKSIEINEKNKIDLEAQEKSLKENIHLLLNEQQIQSIEKVEEILALKLNISEIRKEVEQFTIQFETLKNVIIELESKTENTSFDEDAFQLEQQKLIEAEQKYKSANELVIQLKSEIDRLTKSFEEKKELLINLQEIQQRADNLKIMQNLFYKAGFVQYVSSIYLKQLCENANVRFHRMTRNQLSLQINENNDFEIIDYLNEGKSRSVKTLSGGQSFQVSLSLALALAESVQADAKSEKSFFFIDEGFGTQDLDAVNIVFETLLSLQKENRIVGIISHVEELKERIPMALSVTKDEEKGSIIEVSS
ncbi:exonuclease SbcC [Chishuiella changwenlii]|uniref:Exonuclease SbcC n=1 Tax=Chishuiella changwenlii TaxID=1434701 RepID=A0A1M6YA89_9FLAO|nr:SMC family ATPase [Chishuiella changwenlii]GGE93004.1 nuclease SbcCD subunit C [Chishuiella changwenlii]SHL15161.1 exonuclease SbcC [Chishuiella changwenlii]